MVPVWNRQNKTSQIGGTMKTMKKTVLAICCLVMVAGTAWAVDYSKMSTEDLSRMRGTLYNANQTEWNAFGTETK